MSNKTQISRCSWRHDLEASRNLNPTQKHGYTMLLGWFENYAAVQFWRDQVLNTQKPREHWQVQQWGEAIAWYLRWLDACYARGADHRSLAERMRQASDSVGMRRGLAKRTRQSYGAWIARYALFAKSAQNAMKPETGTAFLG